MNDLTYRMGGRALLAVIFGAVVWIAFHQSPAAGQPQVVRVPPGVIAAYGGETPPNGWLLCDGSEVSRTMFDRLFTRIGVAHGVGDGISTFNLPDLRGRFVRGVDAGAGRDPDAALREAADVGGNEGDSVGSVQHDGFQGHFHVFEGTHIPYSGGGGSDLHGVQSDDDPTTVIDRDNITDAKDNGFDGAPRTSAETRPLNAYVHFIIKA